MKLQTISPKLPRPRYIQDFAGIKKGLPWYGELLLGIFVFAVFRFGGQAGGILMALFFRAAGISSSSLPPWGPDMLTNVCAFGFAMLLIFLLGRLLQRRRLRSFGFVRKKWASEYGTGFIGGAIAFSLIMLLASLSGTVRFAGIFPGFSLGAFLMMLVGYAVQGMSEEVVLRGFMLPSFCRRNSPWLGALLSGLVFACGHLGNAGGLNLGMIFNVTLVGVCFAVIVLKRGSIWLACGFHTAWNFVQNCLYGLSVSGGESAMSLLSFEPVSENALLTGGAFGLEASIFCSLVLAAVLLFALMLTPVDRSARRSRNGS